MPCEYCNQPYHTLSECEDPRAVGLYSTTMRSINAFPCDFWQQYQILMKLTYPELNIVLHWISDYVDAVSKQSAACKIIQLNFELSLCVGLTEHEVNEAIKHRTYILAKYADENTSQEDFAACNYLLDLIREDYIEEQAHQHFIKASQTNVDIEVDINRT